MVSFWVEFLFRVNGFSIFFCFCFLLSIHSATVFVKDHLLRIDWKKKYLSPTPDRKRCKLSVRCSYSVCSFGNGDSAKPGPSKAKPKIKQQKNGKKLKGETRHELRLLSNCCQRHKFQITTICALALISSVCSCLHRISLRHNSVDIWWINRTHHIIVNSFVQTCDVWVSVSAYAEQWQWNAIHSSQ